MNRKSIFRLCLPVTAGFLLLSSCNNNNPTTSTTSDTSSPVVLSTVSHLPQNVYPICTISIDSFNAWFLSGKATDNGAVSPANSVEFPHRDNCDFYQWAERMFLWVTSPASAEYGFQGRVLESPLFYTVTTDSVGGGLKLIQNGPGQIISAVSALRKTGPNRLPIFSDKNGRLFEVQFHKPGEKVLIKNQAGQVVELGPVQKAAGNFTFVTNLTHPERVLHVFNTPTGTVVFDNNGHQVDTELDQATGDALMAQNGSLVYYVTMVNDMYAYFRTAVKKNKMPDSAFPTTAGARDSIVNYARLLGYPPPADPNALAIEIKSSWVLADKLRDSAGYVTIDAVVPDYDKVNDTTWVPVAKKKVRLALVGIHIVGSASHHPEMIWATFEHNGNTPDSAYQYLASNGQTRTVPSDTGRWLFSSAAGAPFNQTHIKVSKTGDNLKAPTGYTISASNTLREFAFGVAFGTRPNQQDTTDAASNSEVIGMNNAVINNIPGNDIRKNYHLIGATWTNGGAAPNGNVYAYPNDTIPGVSIGTNVLANSTMETYFQQTYFSCLTCHNGSNLLWPDTISHIFHYIRPLGPIPRK